MYCELLQRHEKVSDARIVHWNIFTVTQGQICSDWNKNFWDCIEHLHISIIRQEVCAYGQELMFCK